MKPVQALPLQSLYQHCTIDQPGFRTSHDLEALNDFIGQERAVEAIELGSELSLQGFNIFALGSEGTGRHTFIKNCLLKKAARRRTPSDWCYVNNFDEPRKPKAIELPAGKGRLFRDQVERLIEDAQAAISAAFESEDYHEQRQAIEKIASEEQEQAFEQMQKHAQEAGFRIVQSVTGFNFIPLVDGKLITPKQYQELPEDEQSRLQQESGKLEIELRKMLRTIPHRERQLHEKIRQLNDEVASFAVSTLIEELLERYAHHAKIVEFLQDLKQDIVNNVDLFKQPRIKPPTGPGIQAESDGYEDMLSSISHRYAVNLIVDCSKMEGAPVVVEDHPTYPYLVGQIEHVASMGTLFTDFTLIRAGALHRANGGYLIIDVRKILEQPFAWDGLKRALNAQQIDIKSIAQAYSLMSTVSIEPEPIPLDIKVVLIGDQLTYYLLQTYDPEFLELFKVAADFENDMERNDINILHFARLISTVARQENLKPINKQAIERIIEESSRIAGDSGRLSTRIRRLADIVREAHYWSSQQKHEVISVDHVTRAIEGRRQRKSRFHDQIVRGIMDKTIMIDTQGEAVGQVNGLTIIQMGDFYFGHPARITARYSLGAGKVIDIEREVELGGPIHSKGVLILSNFIASHYAPDHPLSLSASLVFEQSYGPVEGDSASAAELCALLSALAGVPIKQSIAITGSVNQHGQIQAIGGVNQKIEGFFEICQSRGLNGTQGVIIPQANVRHLMLRQNVLDAVAAGQFAIYSADRIEDCLHVLTGAEAGQRDAGGQFAPDTINYKVQQQLIALADKRQKFSSLKDDKKANN